jgi:hypothetical protein
VARKKPYLLRIDEQLHDELRRWAADDLRSLNAQLEFLLRRELKEWRGKDPGPPSPADPDEAEDAS